MYDRHCITEEPYELKGSRTVLKSSRAGDCLYSDTPVIPGISQNPCLFTAINKDSAEIYYELIPFDAGLAQKMSDKAVNIIRAIEAEELLPRAFTGKDFFECKVCPYNSKCWNEL